MKPPTRGNSNLPAVLSVCLLLLLSSIGAVSLPGQNVDTYKPTLIEQAFHSMYNLEFQQAHQQIDAWQKLHPEDPMGPVAHATAFLFDEFARLGILEAQLFVDDKSYIDRKKQIPDPNIKKLFLQALSNGDRLTDAALKKNPSDTNAQFAKVLSLGLRSDYAALIDRRDLAALSYTKQGRIEADKLLKEKPDDYDAYIALGVENYLTGIKPAPVRWFLQLGGMQTDKQQGIADLQKAAAHGNLLAPFARLLLAVAALRDKNTAKACDLLHGLASSYPKNTLYTKELWRCH